MQSKQKTVLTLKCLGGVGVTVTAFYSSDNMKIRFIPASKARTDPTDRPVISSHKVVQLT